MPGHKLSKNLNATNDIKNKDLINSDIYIFAIPTQYLRPILIKLKKYLNKKSLIVNASKGIEIKSLKFINEVFNETLNVSPRKYITLSGPSFAKDVIAELPTAVTLASKSGLSLEMVSSIFDNTNLKVYRSNDIQGVEIAGALKNVIAIGAGIIDGVGNSESTKAAFITRSLFEIRQFSKILGAKEKTFLDYQVWRHMLACYGIQSRNRNLGFMIGKGIVINQFKIFKFYYEGYYTSKAL